MAGPHYVTACLLKQFFGNDGGLRQLDKAKDSIVPRINVQKAGSEFDIWSDEIERGPMQAWDTDGHRVLRRIVNANGEIQLSRNEQSQFKLWTFIFLLRSPVNRKLCVDLYEREQNSGRAKASILQDFTQNFETMLETFRGEKPECYAELVQQCGSEQNLKSYYRQTMFDRIISGETEKASSGVGLFQHMLTSGHHAEYIRHIRKMKWTWLRSETDFVIGDNPFCRSKRGVSGFDYGISFDDLEITFPLSRRLCLWMHRLRGQPDVMQIRPGRTYELNRRQIESALRFAWGPSETALMPPTVKRIYGGT